MPEHMHQSKRTNLFIIAGITVYLLFILSSLYGHGLDVFFLKGDQVHDGYKVDFFQVPGAFTRFTNGGPLGGAPSSPDIPNVYHPVFTIFVGLILAPFAGQAAYMVWTFAHVVIWILTGWYVYKTFHDHKLVGLALLFFFGLFPHYLEIRNGQYHFLLNSLITVLLVLSGKKQAHKIVERIVYTTTLFIKPVTLLWAFAYVQSGRKQTAIIGTCFFGLITAVFVVASFLRNQDMGLYYVVNLLAHTHPTGSTFPQIFTLDALAREMFGHAYNTLLVKVPIGISIIVWAHIRRPSLFTQLFIWTAFYLLFYDLVFEYHYTTLAPFFTIGVLTQQFFRKPVALILMATYLLPTPYLYMKLFGIGTVNETVTMAGWTALVLWRTLPLVVLSLLATSSPLFRSGTTRGTDVCVDMY